MRRYRARLKENKCITEALAEASGKRSGELRALDNATEVATAAAAVPGSVAAEADECMFVCGPDAGAGFLVYSQGGIVREIQPVTGASAFV